MKGKFLLTLAVLLILSTPVFAGPVTLPALPTMADLVAAGSNGFVIGDKLFYNFVYRGSGFGGATAIPAEGISVTILDIPLNPGFAFIAPWSVGPGQGLDSNIRFWVKVLPGGGEIKDISAEMEGFSFLGGGVVNVAETVKINADITKVLVLSDSTFGTVASASTEFASTMGPIQVTKDIAVNGNLGTASVSYVTNQFSEDLPVSEPGTLLLLGSGLIGLGLFSRRK